MNPSGRFSEGTTSVNFWLKVWLKIELLEWKIYVPANAGIPREKGISTDIESMLFNFVY